MNPVKPSEDREMGISGKEKMHQYPRILYGMKSKQTVMIGSNVVSKKSFITFGFPFLYVLFICLSGCGNKFFDPTQTGRFRPVPAVNVILDSLGVAEEAPSPWVGAEEPRPIDVRVFETDYVFNPGDIVRITIFELLQEGVTFTNDYVVTETGKLTIPEVGEVQTEGLTESQLEEQIRQILSPNVLREPSVIVTLLSSQQRLFSILGDGVPAPGRYTIPRFGFKLNDALAVAGGISQFNISYVYVSRAVTGKEPIFEPIEPGLIQPKTRLEPDRRMLETITPWAKGKNAEHKLVLAASEMITNKELAEVASPEGLVTIITDGRHEGTDMNEPALSEGVESVTDIQPKSIDVDKDVLKSLTSPAGQETIDIATDKDDAGRIEWIFKDGRWIPVQVGRPRPTEPAIKVEPEKPTTPLEQRIPPDFEWEKIGTAGVQTRVIKIPTDKLFGGDPRYNVVIRPGDNIHVPVDIIGECCIMGNVNYQGYVNITGRPMTLKMAIAAAGGLGPLAWPKRCEVIRRIGKEKEEIVMVDLDKIARGEQPDFFIKPNDLINVGTHPTSRWRAVLRNAFRATYGFGFVYDRNFADRDFGTRRPIPHWF